MTVQTLDKGFIDTDKQADFQKIFEDSEDYEFIKLVELTTGGQRGTK